MAKFRLVADEPRMVPWLGGQLIQPDHVITVPDAHYEAYACQPAVWESVAEPRTSASKTSAQSAGKDGK